MAADDRFKDDERFIIELFKKIDINISPQQVRLLICHNDYDDYEVIDDQGRFLRVKISFEQDSPSLKRESANLKAAQSPVCGYWLGSGNVKLGDDFSYLLCGFRPSDTLQSLVLQLRNEAGDLLPDVSQENVRKCHGKLSPDSIFWGGDNFYFDNLYKNCLGHPFVDFIELMLECGFSRDHEKELLPVFCEHTHTELDARLYQKFYSCLMRKKLVDLISAYIYEVYLFNSYRMDRILNVADTFSLCYDRFRAIPVFEDSREFVLKTLTEPILGVKA
jgi:hypothetical protein